MDSHEIPDAEQVQIMQEEWALLMEAFGGGSPDFGRGFELGHYYGLLRYNTEDVIDGYLQVANEETARDLARHFGHSIEITPVNSSWHWVVYEPKTEPL